MSGADLDSATLYFLRWSLIPYVNFIFLGSIFSVFLEVAWFKICKSLFTGKKECIFIDCLVVRLTSVVYLRLHSLFFSSFYYCYFASFLFIWCLIMLCTTLFWSLWVCLESMDVRMWSLRLVFGSKDFFFWYVLNLINCCNSVNVSNLIYNFWSPVYSVFRQDLEFELWGGCFFLWEIFIPLILRFVLECTYFPMLENMKKLFYDVF